MTWWHEERTAAEAAEGFPGTDGAEAIQVEQGRDKESGGQEELESGRGTL